MTSTFLPSAGELVVIADAGESIQIQSNANPSPEVEVLVDGVLDPGLPTILAANVQTLIVRGGEKANAIDLSGVSGAAFTALANITVDGGDGNDTILGTNDANLTESLLGGDGNDLIQGQDGNDTIDAGDGNDSVDAGGGNDSVIAGNGNDSVSGQDGGDTLIGGDGDDVLNGDAGDDTLSGGNGSDSISGGDGGDSINGGQGGDTLIGDAGNDQLFGDTGADALYGDSSDTSASGSGNDSLWGQSGNDTLNGGGGADQLNGGTGNDVIQSGNDSSQTSQRARLFVVPADGSNTIAELDPTTGLELNRFAAPEAVSSGPDGLAFDGTTLYFINGFGTDTLYELDPATGAVLDATPITVGSGSYDGLAALSGQVYILDYGVSDILVFDPNINGVTNVLDIDGTNLGITLVGGIAGITSPNRIVATQGAGLMVHEIDPATGLVTASFSPSTADAGQYIGAGVLDGEIYLGVAAAGTVDVFSRTGLFQRTLSLPYGVSALGADDVGSTLAPLTASFDITLNLEGSWTADQTAIIDAAAQRWEQIVTGDLPDVAVPGFGLVDDLTITVRAASIDGPGNVLAGSSPTFLRSDSLLPAAGEIVLDSADLTLLQNNSKLSETLLHEIGHVLGIGTIWADAGLLSSSGTETVFTGPQAIAQYNALTHASVAGVPVETAGGADVAGHHWREGVFGTELMTGYAESGGTAEPISRVTVASLADLGYTVDLDRADNLAPAGMATTFASLGAAGTRARFLEPGPKLGKRVVLDQPTSLVDTLASSKSMDGQIVHQNVVNQSSGTANLEREPNNSIPTAQNVDNENWNLTNDPNIGDSLTNTSTTVPHITISGTGDGTFDYYSFTASNAGDRGIFDIDFGSDLIGNPGSMDTELFLFDAAGNLLAQNDDTSTTAGAGGSVSGLDSYIEFNFSTPGLYVIGVGEFPSTGTTGGITGNVPDVGDTYTLQVSIQNHSLGGGPAPPPTPPPAPAAVADTLLGGDGDDLLIAQGGDDSIDGGLGNDTIDAGDGNDSVLGSGGRDSILGGRGDDQLNGQGSSDTMDGGAGNDLIKGGDGGNDSLVGGTGDDTLSGSLGNDTLDGGAGNDFLFGSGGADWLVGGTGDDYLKGQGGTGDTLDGGSGLDTLVWDVGSSSDVFSSSDTVDAIEVRGTSAADQFTIDQSGSTLRISDGVGTLSIPKRFASVAINAGGGDDIVTVGDVDNVAMLPLTVNGESGRDLLTASGASLGSVSLTLDGGFGADTLLGSLDSDTLLGGGNNDLILGSDGVDSIRGDAGDDTLNGDAGNDSVAGGDGNDVVFGGNGDDNLAGDAGNDMIDGNDGHDMIVGGTGNDTLNGGAGNGSGNDTLLGETGTDYLFGGIGNDSLDGGSNDDYVSGQANDDTVRGGDGNDTVLGGAHNDYLLGGDGDDSLDGGSGNNAMAGNDGNDTLAGGTDDETILGGDGNDFLFGNTGNDVVLGGDGNDFVTGHGGSDTLAGGEGIDTVVGNAGEIDESFVLSTTLLSALDEL